MNLYKKLLLAQSPIALALVALGIFSVVAISYMGSHSQTILKDNYRSVLAAQRMKEAIERMDSAALFLVAGQNEKGVQQAAKYRPIFEAELKVQESNITEAGEKEFTAGLRAAWTDYQAKFDRLQATAGADEIRRLYFSELEVAFYKVKASADEILAINQDTMVRKSDNVRRTGERMNAITITVALAALALGLLVSTLLTRRMLQPLSALSEATRKIGEGNFDARAHVHGHDELARLAHDFNAMAARLAEYRKSSLGDLLQAHLSMQAAIDSIPDPVAIFSVEGSLQNVNRAAETLLGLRTDSSSKDPLKSVHASTVAVIDRVRSHVLSGKGTYSPRGFEDAVQLSTLLGDRYFLPRGAPVYETRGVVVGATVILQDVTRLRRFEELKNDLVATVAHEFRTPLTSLRMAVHLCTEQVAGPLTDKQAELLYTAREDCDRLQGMVDDFLDLSRIESGRVELYPLPANASGLMMGAVDEFKADADAKGVILSAEVPLQELSVLADHDRIGHVFSNLIGNAVRHTPKGGSITLGAEPIDGSVRFTVADSGTGVPKEYQERIFEKFYRVPESGPKGTGLGLYIVKEIVRAHGGEIGVESEPGKGEQILVHLALSAKTRLQRSPAMMESKSRILVADDERNIRKNLAMVLEAAGYLVDVAKDGDEALELCKNNHPDIAFVDLHMPKMAGLNVLANIRALSPKTAVVIVTAYGSATNAVQAMKLGAVEFLEKPFDPKVIVLLAEEILFRQRLGAGVSFDDLMHLAQLARERKANIEARAYLKSAMSRALDRPEPYYWLGFLCENEGDERRAVQYYYMAITADHSYEAATAALKRLGKLH